MSTQPFSVIEVGTSHTVILIGQTNDSGGIDILAAANRAMTGLRKSAIVNAPYVRTGIVTALGDAVLKHPIPERYNWLIFSGGNVSSNIVSNTIMINGPITTKVMKHSIQTAVESNKGSVDNRSILHTVAQNYTRRSNNTETTVTDPQNLSADSLQANVLLIHGDLAPLRDLNAVVQESHMHVCGHLFSAVCAGRAVLSKQQRTEGVLLINIGGGTTSFTLHYNNILRSAASIPIGGDHATNDLSLAFKIATQEAEQLKIKYSSADIGDAKPDDTALIPASSTKPERLVSLRDVNTVVNARFDELFRIVYEKLPENANFTHVVLVGGCALQKGILKIAENVFRRPCSIGRILDDVHIGSAADDPLYATAYGALFIARDELNELEQNAPPKTSIFNLFKKAVTK